MPFDPTLAAIRFGCGLSPVIAPPQSVDEMLGALAGSDRMAARFPIPGPYDINPTEARFRTVQRERRLAGTSHDAARIALAEAAYDVAVSDLQTARRANFAATLARCAEATDGFRERLTRFWADHFTVRAKSGALSHLVTPYVEDTIRPRMSGRFADLLKAVVTSPMMLLYLDQVRSMGPNSQRGLRVGRGLNENLARELLELHTLGVGGPYDQTDVRELAELMTGLNYRVETGFYFAAQDAEPGSETVLGVTYGAEARLETVMAAMEDLGTHPQTARHIAMKLASHFVADTPDPALVAELETRFNDTGGDLAQVYAALLAHPAAWDPVRAKVKQPIGFITSSLRALGVPGARLLALTVREQRRYFDLPLRVMGQNWERPTGPDGWPEAAEDWVTPQGMAGRIDWAMRAPEVILSELPDPRDFAPVALGSDLPDAVAFAAGAAENRAVGIGVVLASAAFQRR